MAERMELLYDSFIIKSRAIEGNPIGNSKDIETFVVHGKETEGKPILIFLPGFLGSGKGMLFNEDPLAENMENKLERLYRGDKIKGAIYAFPNISGLYGKKFKGKIIKDSFDFADFLLEQVKVAVVPGAPFGAKDNMRLSYATSLETIKKGLERIEQAIAMLE